MDWKPAKICVAILVLHELFMIAMAASEIYETNRGARECTPLTPEFRLNFFVLFSPALGIRSIVIMCYIMCPLKIKKRAYTRDAIYH